MSGPRDPKRRLTTAELRLLETNGSPAMQSAARELLAMRDWFAKRSGAWPAAAGSLTKALNQAFGGPEVDLDD